MRSSRVCVSRTSRVDARSSLACRGRRAVRGCVRGVAPLPTYHTALGREQDRHGGGPGIRCSGSPLDHTMFVSAQLGDVQ